MTTSSVPLDIAHQRLVNQHLKLPSFSDPQDIVSYLGAVQAQDYAMAKWGLGMRLKNATDLSVEKAFNEGTILRTHVMRPTWHFVTPENIRWMLALTAPRIKAFMNSYNKKLELDDALFKKSNAAIVKALHKDTYLTRQELKSVLGDIGIGTDVQRLAHIVMWAELDGLICSGPRRGKPASTRGASSTRGGQFTYSLLETRVPKTKVIDTETSRARLAQLYFTSHGPAQLKDFSWWSGLSVKDSERALESIKDSLYRETIENKTYWLSSRATYSPPQKKLALLLSIYDEYTIAYKDRNALGGTRYIEKLLSMGNWLTAVMIYDGSIVGTWKRTIKKDTVDVRLFPFEKLTLKETSAFASAVTRYKTFVGA